MAFSCSSRQAGRQASTISPDVYASFLGKSATTSWTNKFSLHVVRLPAWLFLSPGAAAAGATNVAALLLWPFISESARWLLSQGRTAEAAVVLCKIAQHNGTRMPEEPLVSGNNKRELTAVGSHKHVPPAGIDCAVSLRTASDSGCESVGIQKDVEQGRLLSASDEEQQQFGFSQLLQNSSMVAHCLVLMITWFALLLSYYGLALGAGGLPGSM
jgi:hypothetical protein